MFSKTYELDIDGEVNGPINYNIVDAGNIIGTVFLVLIAILLLIAICFAGGIAVAMLLYRVIGVAMP